MLKLVRLALTAVTLAAIALRLWRTPPVAEEPAREPHPILGRPTASDLARYAPRPPGTRRFAKGVAAGFTAGLLVAGVGAVAVAGAMPSTPDTGGPATRAVARATETPAPAPSATRTAMEAATASVRPCVRPAPGARVLVRPVDLKVKRAVDRQWRLIETWLKRNAPKTHAALRAPARARTIAVAEAQTGLRFPDDLRASLLRHDGTSGAGAFAFLDARAQSVREIRDEWRLQCDLDLGWEGSAVPFATGGGEDFTDLMVVDAKDGDVGYFDGQGEGLMYGYTPSWPSYYALLKDTATALRTGGELGGHTAAVADGALTWKLSRTGP
ncbi:SMI1/KNR4 family protein [Nonomuraea sp. NPDC046570]|uniref:SMI1/KNR4 family protein n=1 Tax=Nonomuraea sp. NPDC046570 TaxID=3155255 RepID=UPI00340DA98E